MKNFDVVVVGMGPAGMTAAVESAERGLRVAVFDENPRPGGQIYRQSPHEFKRTDGLAPGLKNQAGQQLIDRFNQLSGTIEIFQNTLIWGIFDDRELTFKRDQTCDGVGFNKLILCEGACERTVPFPGWTLPGVMTLGGLQKFILHQRVLPGQRVLLSGSGPLLLAVGAEVLKAGAESLTLCEASNMKGAFRLLMELLLQRGLLSEAFSYLGPILKRLIPVHRSRAVIAARGDGRVEEVDTARLDDNWKPIPGTGKTFRVDVVGLGFGFQPMARLCRLAGCRLEFDLNQRAFKPVVDANMRTSRTDIYAAGDSAGIGGSRMALVEGQLAALHAASTFGTLPPGELDQVHNRLNREKEKISRYMARLDEMFTPRPGIFDIIEEETVVCRCEETTAKDLLNAIRMKHLNLNAIKKRIRLGMGPCQGKTCESIAVELGLRAGVPLSELDSLTIRPPATPIPMSVMADCSVPETGTM
jgi:D-hydroxyproline dehydrogenase subunit alpha